MGGGAVPLNGVSVRRGRADDAEALSAIYRPYVEGSRISFEMEAPDTVAFSQRMMKAEGRYPWLVALDATGAPLGYAYAGQFRERPAYRFAVETSIYLAPSAYRLGIGRRLYGLLLDILAEQGFIHAIGAVTIPNSGSEALHRAMGFMWQGEYRAIGYKMDEWASVALFQKQLTDALPKQPAEPLPLEGSAIWRAIDP